TEQKERAQADARAKKTGGLTDTTAYRQLRDSGETLFTGYENLTGESHVRGIIKDGKIAPVAVPGDKVDIVLDETPFYAESGGQRADAGVIRADGFAAKVVDVQRPVAGLIVHRAEVTDGELQPGTAVEARVDDDYRLGACQAHSATHLVH